MQAHSTNIHVQENTAQNLATIASVKKEEKGTMWTTEGLIMCDCSQLVTSLAITLSALPFGSNKYWLECVEVGLQIAFSAGLRHGAID